VSTVNLDLFRYRWIHLQPAIVNDDRFSRQSSIDIFRYYWIRLQATIINEGSVSRQSSIYLFRYRLVHLQAAGAGRTVSAINLDLFRYH
jgi:hypothetical protein